MVDKRTLKLLSEAVYCITNSSCWTESILDPRQHLVTLLNLQEDASMSDLEARLANNVDTSLLTKLLRENYFLEVDPNNGTATMAVFRDIIPELSDYVRANGADSFTYDESLVAMDAGGALAAFTRIDSIIPRAGKKWTLDLFGESGQIEISPITTMDEINTFRGLDAPFCYFDTHQNHAQMYLYAAHHHTAMLGLWHTTDTTPSTNRLPVGIIPVLLMQNEKTKPGTQQVQGLPFLYVESVMLKTGWMDNLVKTNEKITSLSDALIDVIASYTSLLAVEPYPLIGTCRKDDSKYSGTTNSLIDAASARWHNLLSNKVGQRDILNPLNGRIRVATKPRFENSYYLSLVEDVLLLNYLQQGGYPFPTIVMDSHAFLNEYDLKKNNRDNSPARKVLYGQWGEVKGWTSCISIPGYFDLQNERIFPQEGGR
jgi:hypothetical protein